jgi:hypothetical protein
LVPTGGWGFQVTKNRPRAAQQNITAYCISASMKVEGGVGLTFLGVTHQTVVVQASFFLNGTQFAQITGTATVTNASGPGPVVYTDWASTAWYSTNSMVPTTPTQVDGGNTNHLGQISFISGGRGGTPTFVLLTIVPSAFNISANPFTTPNTVSITGQVTVTGDGSDCTGNAGIGHGLWPLSGAGPQVGALISAKQLITANAGASWIHGPSQSFTSFGASASVAPIPGGSQIYTTPFTFVSGNPTFLA